MDTRTLTTVCRQIYQRFPEMKGVQPSVQAYNGEHNLLIFKGRGTGADGRTIQRTVRVVVGSDGKIGKITTSR